MAQVRYDSIAWNGLLGPWAVGSFDQKLGRQAHSWEESLRGMVRSAGSRTQARVSQQEEERCAKGNCQQALVLVLVPFLVLEERNHVRC